MLQLRDPQWQRTWLWIPRSKRSAGSSDAASVEGVAQGSEGPKRRRQSSRAGFKIEQCSPAKTELFANSAVGDLGGV